MSVGLVRLRKRLMINVRSREVVGACKVLVCCCCLRVENVEVEGSVATGSSGDGSVAQ